MEYSALKRAEARAPIATDNLWMQRIVRPDRNVPCRVGTVWYFYCVSLENIKAEIAGMPQKDRDQLAAYLVHLRHRRDPMIPAEIRTRIEDKDPANGVSLDELKESQGHGD